MNNEYFGKEIIVNEDVKYIGDDDYRHPWGKFLDIRLEVIKWLTDDLKYDDVQIAKSLSMDDIQVYLIKKGIPYKELEKEKIT